MLLRAGARPTAPACICTGGAAVFMMRVEQRRKGGKEEGKEESTGAQSRECSSEQAPSQLHLHVKGGAQIVMEREEERNKEGNEKGRQLNVGNAPQGRRQANHTFMSRAEHRLQARGKQASASWLRLHTTT